MAELRMGLKVVCRREALGLTQAELGARAGLSRVTINKIENGRVEDIGTKTLLRLAEALKVSPSYLLCG